MQLCMATAYKLLACFGCQHSGPSACIHLAGCIPEMAGRTLTNPRTLRRSSAKDGGVGRIPPFSKKVLRSGAKLGEPVVKALSCKPQSAVCICFALKHMQTAGPCDADKCALRIHALWAYQQQ